jgi:hypothetical protein
MMATKQKVVAYEPKRSKKCRKTKSKSKKKEQELLSQRQLLAA